MNVLSEPSALVDVRDRAVWITLNRPTALNSITPDTVAAINAGLDRAEADDIKAVVITGRGRAFCAGADLKFVRCVTGDDEGALKTFLESVHRLMDRIERFPRPVIAAINGVTVGGGLELVLCCDLVIAAHSARIGDGHINFGLLPGGGSSVRLPRKIGSTRAKLLLFTGDLASAEDLAVAGLVNEVVDDGDLLPAAERLVARLSNKSPLTLRRVKALVDDGLGQPTATALRLELLVSEVHAHSHDQKEGLAAFEEKRKPNFIGR